MVDRQTRRSEPSRATPRDKLLAAARKLFARDGYDATTMQDVVSEADTSIGNAYFYFGSKEKLLLEMVGDEAERLWDQSDAAVAQVPAGPARIAALIHGNVSWLVYRNSDLARLLFATDQRLSTIRVIADIGIRRWRSHLVPSFPELSPQQIDLAATAIFGVNRYVVELVQATELGVSPGDAIEFAVRWNLRALGVAEREIGVALRNAAKLSKALALRRSP